MPPGPSQKPSARSSIRYLEAGDDTIEIAVLRKRRKTMAIHVFPDKPVELRVPFDCPAAAMEAFLASRRQWIIDSLQSLAGGVAPRSPCYGEGERHEYLGRLLPLRLVEGRTRRVSVTADAMTVRCKRPDDADEVRRALEAFYRAEALKFLPQRLELCRLRFADGLVSPPLTVRKMRAKWGSCSSRGEVCLNSLLMQKPVAAVDFVVTHELCHLRHFAHNKSFYRLMDSVMSDWREREKLLVRPDVTLQLELF